MLCIVPGCASAGSHSGTSQLICFPESSELCARWMQAIEFGTGSWPTEHIGEDHELVICRWHFGETPLNEYREPSVFLNRTGEQVEIGSCRICLQFHSCTQMVSKDDSIGQQSLAGAARKTLRIALTDEDFLSEICLECLVRIDVLKAMLIDVRRTEKEFTELALKVKTTKMYYLDSNDMKEHTATEDGNSEKKLDDDTLQHLLLDQEVCTVKEEQLDEPILELVHISVQGQPKTERPKRKPGRPRKFENYTQEKNAFKSPDHPNEGEGKRKAGRPRKQQSGKRNTTKEKTDYKEILSRKCFICETLLENNNELMFHLTSVHAAKVDYRCEECNKCYTKVTSFNHHLSFHDHANRPHKCRYCSLGYGNLPNLRVHENREHNAGHIVRKANRAPRRYQCDACGKTYKCNYQLKEHDDFYHKKLAFAVCTICGKSFPTKTLLKKHHIVHSGERPYRCAECGESFKNSTCLTSHVRKHQEGYAERKAAKKKQAASQK